MFCPVRVDNIVMDVGPRNNIWWQFVVKSLFLLHVVPKSSSHGRGTGLSPSVVVFSAIAVNDIVVILVASDSRKTQKNVTVSMVELNL
jgi:hypothetical protein